MNAKKRQLWWNLWPVMMLSVLPTALLLILSYRAAERHAEESLADLTRDAKARFDEILEQANRHIDRVVQDTSLVPNEATQQKLSRLIYDDIRFREAGIMDLQHRLVLTDRGPVVPPILVEPESRPDPRLGYVQILGRIRTRIMDEESLIFARSVPNRGAMNLLVQPELLLYQHQAQDLGPTGYLAFDLDERNQVLTGLGAVPIVNDQFERVLPRGRLRATSRSRYGRVLIIAEVSRAWALRFWWRELGFALPVTILSTLGVLWLYYRAQQTKDLGQELEVGLARGEFEVFYQPIVELSTGRWIGAEALLRWNHPRQGRIRPDVFIPMAEETGFIRDLTSWLLLRANLELEPVFRERPQFYLSINLPPRLLMGGVAQRILASLPASAALTPDRIMFELTERHLLAEQADVIVEMQNLASSGVRFAVDDFGTGYSSLAYLHQFPFHGLKIDKSFLPTPGRTETVAVVLDTLIELGQKLNLSLIAEGIELEDQANHLKARGVPYGQGWLYSAALPAAAFRSHMEPRIS